MIREGFSDSDFALNRLRSFERRSSILKETADRDGLFEPTYGICGDIE
jgi:hypothetical protein